MSSKFNTSTVTSDEPATESTLSELKNLIEAGTDVNVTNFTSGINADITKINGFTISTGSNLPITIENSTIALNTNATIQNPSINTNATIQNASINTNATIQNASIDTNATIQNASINTNATIQNASINTNATIQNASLDVNIINSDLNSGPTNSTTYRVTLANDQNSSYWQTLPVKIVKEYENIYHFTSNWSSNAASENWIWADPTNGIAFNHAGFGFILNSIYLLPSNANFSAYLYSTSIEDLYPSGNGITIMSVTYVSFNDTITTVQVNMNGETPVLIAADFFRLVYMVPAATGNQYTNDGTIYILGGSTIAAPKYPGVMLPKTAKYQSALIYLKKSYAIGGTYKNTGYHRGDYMQYNWLNASGAREELCVRIKPSKSNIWVEQMKQYNNNDIFQKVDISNVRLDNALGYDIAILTYRADVVGTSYLTWGLGFHTE